MWFTAGPTTNPANGDVLADTGAIVDGGAVQLKVLVTATVLETVNIQHRNAANDTTITDFIVRVPINDTRFFDLGTLTLQGNERVRIVQQGILVGSVQALIVQD